MQLHGVEIKGWTGDITKAHVDAIVNAANSYLTMGGGVAGALRRKGGASIEEEAIKKAPIPIGQAVVTGAGRLRAKHVIHAPTMRTPGPTSADNVYLATRAALMASEKLGVRSMAFPGMGTGVGGVDPDHAAAAMVRAMREHLAGGSGLATIILMDIDPTMIGAFKRQLTHLPHGPGT